MVLHPSSSIGLSTKAQADMGKLLVDNGVLFDHELLFTRIFYPIAW